MTHGGPHLLEAELSGGRVVRVLAHPDGAPEAEGQPLHLGVADRGQMAEILALIEQLDHKKAPRPLGSLESRIPVIEDAPTAATGIPKRPAAEVKGTAARAPAPAATPVLASRTDAYDDDDDAPTLMQPSGKLGPVAPAATPAQKGYVPSLALNLGNTNPRPHSNQSPRPHTNANPNAGSTNPTATVRTNPAAFSDTLLPPSSFVERTLLLPIGMGGAPAPSAISARGFEVEAAQVQERPAPATAPSERRISLPRADEVLHPRVDLRAEEGPTELHVRPTRARDARGEPGRPAVAAPAAAFAASPGSSGSRQPIPSHNAPAPHAPYSSAGKPAPAPGPAPALAPAPAGQHSSGPGGPIRLLGRTIAGKYTIDSSIGRGATAEVFRAQHASLKRPVAVKILHQENAGYVQFVKRFKAEAHTLSKLEHQNIARVIDFGQEPDGLLYLVMELLVGKSLEVVLGDSGKKLPVKKVLDVGVQTCNALAFAHDEGVIHRDVKPENVVLVPHRDEDGKPCDLVKVCDFGLAKLRDPDPENTDITMGGTLCGSPAYMSPEQILGEKLDARTDLYALATMLYESLTGELPHDAVGLTQLFAKKLMEAPTPIRSYLPDIDPGLEASIMRGLSREPTARQDDARVLRQELRAVLSRLG